MATTEIITCINCPVGCRMEVTHEGETVLSVKGNTCKRGDAYARQECVAPLRMVTAAPGSVATMTVWPPVASDLSMLSIVMSGASAMTIGFDAIGGTSRCSSMTVGS